MIDAYHINKAGNLETQEKLRLQLRDGMEALVVEEVQKRGQNENAIRRVNLLSWIFFY